MKGKPRRFGIGLNQLADAVVLHVGIIVVYVVRLDMEALVKLRMRGIDELLRAFDEFVYPLPRARADWHHRDAKLKRKAFAIDCIPVFCHFIHHVQGDDHRPLQFEKLHGQV